MLEDLKNYLIMNRSFVYGIWVLVCLVILIVVMQVNYANGSLWRIFGEHYKNPVENPIRVA
jgi:hypothetical protein